MATMKISFSCLVFSTEDLFLRGVLAGSLIFMHGGLTQSGYLQISVLIRAVACTLKRFVDAYRKYFGAYLKSHEYFTG